MNGREFVRRTRRHARRNGFECRFDTTHGKGSHGMFYLGDRRTLVQQGEIRTGMLLSMLKELGIDRREF